MSEDITVERIDAVAVIRFNRPKQLNALLPEMVEELTDHVAAIDADPEVRAVVLTGTGTSFSSGGDLAFLEQFHTMDAIEVGETVYRVFGGAVKALKQSPKPFVAAVTGPAFGAGCDLALACDVRIGTESALFSESWSQIGIIPALGGLYLLPRIVGLGRATEMVLTGRRIGGLEAERIGLVTQLVEEDQLLPAALATAQALARNGRHANEFIKRGLERGLGSSLVAEWDWARHVQATLISSGVMTEGIEAIRERRKPDYAAFERRR